MREQPSTQPSRTFKIAVLVCLALLGAAVAWLMYRVENLPAASTDKTVTSSDSEDDGG